MTHMKQTTNTVVQRRRRRQRCSAWLLGAVMALLLPGTLSAQSFERGATNVAVLVGSGQAFGDNYLVLGVGAGYYQETILVIGPCCLVVSPRFGAVNSE